MSTITVEAKIHFERRGRGARRVVQVGPDPIPGMPTGRVPRITRLMALAIRFDELIRYGEVADYSERARLGNVSRAPVTQIMNLLMLAPDIQEQSLYLSRVTGGRDPIKLRQLQQIAIVFDWPRQRVFWQLLIQRPEGRTRALSTFKVGG